MNIFYTGLYSLALFIKKDISGEWILENEGLIVRFYFESGYYHAIVKGSKLKEKSFIKKLSLNTSAVFTRGIISLKNNQQTCDVEKLSIDLLEIRINETNQKIYLRKL